MKPVCFAQALIISVSTSLVSITYADDTSQLNPIYLSDCIYSWMKKSDQVSDQFDYKNFGEEFCNCSSSLPAGDEDSIKKATHLCMSKTALHDTIDNLEEELGFAAASDKDVHEYCLDSWDLAYPNQSEVETKTINKYCTCVAPKLKNLMKQYDMLTDQQYNNEVDNIAAICTENKSSTSTI